MTTAGGTRSRKPDLAEVAVCALTYHRPDGLRALLEGLSAMEVPDGTTVRFVIVDNDAAGSAEPAVRAGQQALPGPVSYEVEARRGIAHGRNRAVAAAAGADLVAFIDDDDVPDPRWLAELVATRRRTGADVVTGPVLPRFAEPPPEWVRRGRFFDRPRHPDGAFIHYARTSNVLIDARLFEGSDAPFPEWLGLAGGEDTHFFMRVRLAGARIAWSDRAVVHETIPGSRITAGWLVRRSYRRGNTRSLCLRDLTDTKARRARRAGLGALSVARGAVLIVTAVVGGRPRVVKGLESMAYGIGLVTGLFGLRYDEYARAHGT